jgi:hypothetical protein
MAAMGHVEISPVRFIVLKKKYDLGPLKIYEMEPQMAIYSTCTKEKLSSDNLFLRLSHVVILLRDELPFLSAW